MGQGASTSIYAALKPGLDKCPGAYLIHDKYGGLFDGHPSPFPLKLRKGVYLSSCELSF